MQNLAPRLIRLLIALLLAQLILHAMACGESEPTPPDAPPLPSCVALGCAFALCSSHDGPCTCAGVTCAPGTSDAGP